MIQISSSCVLTHHKDLMTSFDMSDQTMIIMGRRSENTLMKSSRMWRTEGFRAIIPDLQSMLQRPKMYRSTYSIAKPLGNRSSSPPLDVSDAKCRQRLRCRDIGKGFVNTCDYLASGGVQKVIKPLPCWIMYLCSPPASIQKKCRETRRRTSFPHGVKWQRAALFWLRITSANLRE